MIYLGVKLLCRVKAEIYGSILNPFKIIKNVLCI